MTVPVIYQSVKKPRNESVKPSMSEEDIEALCRQLTATGFSPVQIHFYE